MRAQLCLRGTHTSLSGWGGKPKEKKNLDELKQELELDVHKVDQAEIFKRYNSDREVGLTSRQAKETLAKVGPNALTPPPTTPEWVKFCRNLFSGDGTKNIYSMQDVQQNKMSIQTWGFLCG